MKMFKRCMAVLLAICFCLNSSAIASAAGTTVTVSTQKQLDKALKAGKATTIKIVTKKNVKITIPKSSKTKGIKLTVDAPKATVTNKSTFKSITISGDGVKTYTENGKNNSISVTGKNAKVVVSKNTTVKKVTLKGTKASVTVNNGSKITQVVSSKKNAQVTLKVNGQVGSVKVSSEGVKLTVSGNTDTVPVVVEKKNVKVTASVAVDLTLKETANVVLNKGSEGSEIKTESGADAKVTNNSSDEVSVTTPDGDVTVDSGDKVDTVEKPEPTPSTKPDPEPTTKPDPEPSPSTKPDGGSTGGSTGGGSTTVAVTKVELDRETAELEVGKEVQLTATVSPSNATNKTVTWTSSDEAVATVNAGLVKAVAKGTATITAKAGDKTATCVVTVGTGTENPDNPGDGETTPTIKLEPTTATVAVNGTVKLTATTNPEDAVVTWKSSNETIAKVEDGTVTGVKAGKATITATIEGAEPATCEITVTEEGEPEVPAGNVAVTITAEGATISGSAITITTVSPSAVKCTAKVTVDGKEVTENVTYEWKVTETAEVVQITDVDKAVVSVAGIKEGTCKLTVTATVNEEKKTATIDITVEEQKQNN